MAAALSLHPRNPYISRGIIGELKSRLSFKIIRKDFQFPNLKFSPEILPRSGKMFNFHSSVNLHLGPDPHNAYVGLVGRGDSQNLLHP